jgi:hypothetical protein
MADKETKDCWSEGGQIYYCGGSAYGVDNNLQTFCIGGEAEVRQALKDKKMTDNPIINKILREELSEARKQKTTPTPYPKRTRMRFGGRSAKRRLELRA